MIRLLLQAVLPFLAPFAAFGLWRLLAGRGRRLLESTPWYGLTLAGLVLACASLVALALWGGHAPTGRYRPPRYDALSGRVLPALIEPVRHEGELRP